MPAVADFVPPPVESLDEDFTPPPLESLDEGFTPPPLSALDESPTAPADSPNVAGAKAAWEALNKPIVAIPRVTGDEVKQAYPFLSENSADFIAGAQRGAANLIEGIENPLGVATAGAGLGAKIGMKVLGGLAKAGAAGYAGLMAKHLPESAAQTEVAFQQGDIEAGTEAAIGTVASAVLVPTIAGHLAPKVVVARVQRPSVPFVEETTRAFSDNRVITLTEPGATQEAAGAPRVAAAAREAPPVIAEVKAPIQESAIPAPEQLDSLYPKVSGLSDGRVVRLDIPNTSSIESSLNEWVVVPGVRDIPMSEFTLTGKHYSVRGSERIDQLAGEIEASGEINPLIVVMDKEGLYILEGATRAEALYKLGAKSFPAKLVLDTESLSEVKTPETPKTPETIGMGAATPGEGLGITFKNPVLDAAVKKLRGKFTAEGGLPPEVHQLWIKSRGLIGSETRAIDYNVRDLYFALRKEYGISYTQFLKDGMKAVPEDAVQRINETLLGEAPVTGLPPGIRVPVEAMRQHIDRLSTDLLNKGLLDPDLATKVQGNLGTYLTRSYRIFDQGDYPKNIPPKIVNDAGAYILQQLRKNDPAATPEMAATKVREMVADWSQSGVDKQFRAGKLGSKDLSLFMARKDIAPEIRALLGEYKNPVVNYARSITKTARFIGDQEFLNAVRDVGLGDFLFKEGESPPGWEVQLAAPESSVMAPLNGLRTSPQIKEAFETFNKGVVQDNFLFRLYFALNGMTKTAKTVFSGLTQIRNLVGQPFFNLMNGHWNPAPYGKSVKAIAADIGVSDSAAFRDYYRKMTELGLVSESAPAQELRAILKDAGLKDQSYEDVAASGWARVLRKGVEVPIRAYEISDEIGKIVGFENEKVRQSAINPDWAIERVEAEAAARVRNGYPTYSMIAPWVKKFRQQPVIGPFVSFSYEIFRTSFHAMNYALQDLKSGNQAQVKAGAQRVAGIMTALGAGYTLAQASRMMFNIGGEEDDDLRRFLPFWSKNAQLVFMGKSEDGKLKYVNWSYQNPYSYLTDPAVAMLREDERGVTEKMWDSVGEFFRPFANEQILFGAVADVKRNKTRTGQSVYNEQDTADAKFGKSFAHLMTALEPGTLTRLRKRIIPAVKGDQPLYGRSLDPAIEIGAELTGVRMEQFDFKQGLGFNIHKFRKDEDEAEYLFRREVFRSGKSTPENLLSAYETADAARHKLWEKLYQDVQAAKRNGVSHLEIIRMMKANGVGQQDLAFLMRGKYSPLKVSDQTVQRARELKRQLPMAEIQAMRRERSKLPL